MRLTDLGLQRLATPKSGQKMYRDDQIRGFGVRVSQGGGKSFVLMHGERRQLKTIGRYPAMSLKDARQEALRFLVEGDKQPKSEREYASKPASVKETLEAYLEECSVKNKPRTVKCYRRHLQNHLPKGSLGAVTRREIMGRMSKLASVPGEQAHAFTALKIFFNWCLKNGYLETHPLIGITGVGKINTRDRFLDDNELRVVWNKAYAANTTMANIIALCLLTGQRRGEIVQLKWENIDDDFIVLPEEITKNRRAHKFPYGPLTREIIERIPGDPERLFPGRSGGVFNGWSKSKKEFDPEGIKHWQLHDLRRTFASTQAKLGTPVHVIEKILNHVSGTFAGVVGVYNRYDYMDEMQEAMIRGEEYLSSMLP